MATRAKKPAGRKPPPVKRKKPSDGAAAADHVRVRMYCQGLGDCFLLTFVHGGQETHVMIDCGVFLSTEKAPEKMAAVLADVRKTTGGTLDLVIATHEHWDHLSGFFQAPDELKQLTIKNLWTAWTEDPEHPLARRLRNQRGMRRAVVGRMLEKLDGVAGVNGAAADDESLGERIAAVRRVLEFEGLPAKGKGKTKSGGDDIAKAFENLKQKCPAGTEYLKPGQKPMPIPGVPGTRVFVLGPPEDEKALHRLDSEKEGVLYHVATRLAAEAGLAAALGVHDPEPTESPEDRENLAKPFDPRHGVPLATALKKPFLKQHYANPGQSWRRIDEAWLGAAGQLALHLNSYTNNTSLALAIELQPSGRVLLMPGDAQLGNWDTWHALKWKIAGQDDVSIQQLFEKTVLYKVSHHGSHNGTLKDRGLERMTHPELVAMIPVDQVKATRLGFAMPFGKLLKGLQGRTQNRILRVDRDPGKKPAGVTQAAWDRFRSERSIASKKGLYVEMKIPFA